MEISRHGAINALSRAAVSPCVIRNLVETQSYFTLGTDVWEEQKYHYLLLFILESEKFCIAVVDEHFCTLVTVWRSTYRTSKKLARVTKRAKQHARDKSHVINHFDPITT